MGASLIWTGGGISVWQFPLDVATEELFELRELLSPFEFAQAESFHDSEQRSKFIVRRGVLRQLLGERLSCDPFSIEFKTEEWGKPFVVGHTIQFSASSSREIGLVTLSMDGRVGVDIENHNETLAGADFQFHTEEEYNAIVKSANSVELFFRIWARKEACLKVMGQGMRLSLSDISVLPDDSEQTVVVLPEPVVVRDLVVPAGYSAAVAWQAQKKPAY